MEGTKERLGVAGALVGLGVDGGGQVAQGGRGVAQGGLVAVRQLGQGRADDVLVHPVPARHRADTNASTANAGRSRPRSPRAMEPGGSP
jgi:hypothetical protein